MFINAVAVIIILSFIWALWSLRSLSIKDELRQAKEKLKKGRVVYQRTSSSSGE
ncbi:MAG TPA: hypothetical protein VKC89_03205 [Patescibacteria group bacterium]|nr:hypothetical protein [Patescibacteria group bacterium]